MTCAVYSELLVYKDISDFLVNKYTISENILFTE